MREMRGEEGVELRSWVGGMKSKGGVGLWLGQGGMWVSRVGREEEVRWSVGWAQGGSMWVKEEEACGSVQRISGVGAGRRRVGQLFHVSQ